MAYCQRLSGGNSVQKSYIATKNSGIAWNKVTPSHWEVIRGKFIFRNPKELNSNYQSNNVLSLTLKGVINNDVDNPIGLVPKDYATYQLFHKNNLVFKLIDLENFQTSRVGIVHEDGIMSSAYIRLSLKSQSHNVRFFYYQYYDLYLRKIYNNLGAGVRSTMSASDLLNISIVIPPRVEQDQIVRYLDWKRSEIAKLIKAKKKEIKRLKELRNSLINEAVTKGIKPHVKLKPSGIKWITQIPETWNVVPAKALFIQSCENTYNTDEQLTASHKYGIISQKEYMMRENRRIVLANNNLDKWKHVEPGNFIISLRSFQGGLELSNISGCVTWHYVVLVPQDKVFPPFYKWFFKSPSYINALKGTSDFIRDGQDLRYTNFVKVELFEIPLQEQREIALYLDSESNKIDAFVAKIHYEINLLSELRTKIISDVVTGKVDVLDIEIPDFEANDILDTIDNERIYEEETEDASGINNI